MSCKTDGDAGRAPQRIDRCIRQVGFKQVLAVHPMSCKTVWMVMLPELATYLADVSDR